MSSFSSRVWLALAVVAMTGAELLACSADDGGGTAGGGAVSSNGGSVSSGGTGAGGTGGWAVGGAAGSGGTSSGGTAGSASGGTGGCATQCSGKQCGPDGCGQTCGSCASGQSCNASGQCVSTCQPTWKTKVTGATVGDLVFDGASVLAVGTKSDQAWAASFDGCTGALSKETPVTVPSATKSGLYRATLSGGALYAVGSVQAGTDPGNGLYAKLDPSSLTQTFAKPLFGSTGIDEGSAIAAAGVGIWMAGTANVGASGNAWGVKATTSGGACGFPLGSGTGSSKAVAAAGDSVIVARTNGPELYLDMFSDAACPSTAPCACKPTTTAGPIQVGAGSTDPRVALIAGTELYVAGMAWETVSSDVYAFVLRIDLAGNVVGKYTWNPSNKVDGFVALAKSATELYVGGGQGWDSSQPGFATATAVVHALPLGFGMSAAAKWTRSFLDLNVVWGLAVEGGAGDGLFVSATTPSEGVVIRCQQSNVCPP